MRISGAAFYLSCLAFFVTPGAFAASLFGPPFTISSSGARWTFVNVFALDQGAFGAVVVEHKIREKADDLFYYQLFDENGGLRGRKVFVAKGQLSAAMFGSGLPLGDGRFLIAAGLPRKQGEPNESGGVIGQIMERGKPSGEPFSIDQSAPRAVAGGGLLALNGGRGVAGWVGAHNAPMGARFISSTGELDPTAIDISSKGNRLESFLPLKEGFIITTSKYFEDKLENDYVSVYASIYSGAGKRIGSEKTLLSRQPSEGYGGRIALGLYSDNIVFLNVVHDQGFYKLWGQSFNKDWSNPSEPKPLLKLREPYIRAQPLPSGGFAAGIINEDTNGHKVFEVVVFNERLKKIGETARIAIPNYLYVSDMLMLKNGRLLVVVADADGSFRGQLVTP